MRIELRELEAAVGHILCHNLADEQGRREFLKGRPVRAADLERLQALGYRQVRVAVFEAGDVDEDRAAELVAELLAGSGVRSGEARVGRVNLFAAQRGVLYLAEAQLALINALDGVTVATAAAHRVVEAEQLVATIKIIPFAVPQQTLQAVRVVSNAAGLTVRGWLRRRIGVLLIASTTARARVERGVWPALAGRIAALGAETIAREAAEPSEAAVAEGLTALAAAGADLLLVAGETSVVDADDVLPRALQNLGGRVAVYGAPVEPGNLLLIGYLSGIPVIGAPGCVRSRDTNVVDLILPRLMAGEQLERPQIAALGVGGLLSRL